MSKNPTKLKPHPGRVANLKDSKGTRYRRDESGVIRRLDLKPWKGKSERRQCIKARREDRALAAANLAAA